MHLLLVERPILALDVLDEAAHSSALVVDD